MGWTVEFSARLAAARNVGVVRTVSFSVADFLTNATSPTAEEAKTTGWRGSWNPLTSATFDVGVFGVSRGEATLRWVQDED